jgi:acyl-CoA synthetase (AMP-forming)/AMP-acid ligase II
MLMIELFDKGVEQAGDRPFLIEDRNTLTYREVQNTSYRIANALRRAGVLIGARVAVYSHNTNIAFECVIGTLRAGCVWVSANTRNTVDETAYVLNNTETQVLFFSAAHLDAVRRFLPSCPTIQRCFCFDSDDSPFPSLASLLEGVSDQWQEPELGRDDVVTLFSSGGTTGAPKGVMMTNLAWASLAANLRCLQYHSAPVHLVAAPMTHAAGGFVLALCAMGTTNVMLSSFEPAAVMAAIERHSVTHLFLPPTAIYRMLAHPDVHKYDYSSLRYFIYAGAPMAPEKIKEAIATFGPVMATGFGQTEAGLNVTYFSPEEHIQALDRGEERQLLSCGRAAPFSRIEIMNDDGQLLPQGEIGEIVIHSNQTMKGYWNNPEETARAHAFAWLHTGDLGYKDADGWVFIVDRKRDMIISGGFNIFPSEIEKTVINHPAVEDCIVVGVPDDDWGEAVTAVVQLKRGIEITASELTAFCRERLGGIRTPKKFEFWTELPQSAVGKSLRRKVREHFWKSHSRRI